MANIEIFLISILIIAVVILIIYFVHKNQVTQQLGLLQQALKLQIAEIQTSLVEKNQQYLQATHENSLQNLSLMQKSLHTTITDVIQRLAVIDGAQQKITNLSENIVSLQQLLSDKRSRGAFGEVQLKNLIENMLPSKNVSFQYVLSNNLRCDCMLHLPEPIGNLAIDAKFPLESYYAYIKTDNSATEQQQILRQFRQDIKKHIQDIANKYIMVNETADGAIMFIPAEAIFAEIHNTLPEVVSYAYEKHVWLASPTTMMAILTIASAVLRDIDTKEHIHIIQEHLKDLGKDFARFDERLQKFVKHINLVNEDAQQVITSAKKISLRFAKIEQAETKLVTEVCK